MAFDTEVNPLDAVELRVLGSLLEKESTTPEYYPLSLNALVNACNQKSNRHPVVDYDERIVLESLETLRARRFAAVIVGSGRVDKYAQRFSETLNLGRREIALLCTLMLRGPQTVGELHGRSERMHHFTDIEEVDSCLQRLADREEGAFITKLPRQPGQKEARYAHLLGGEIEMDAPVYAERQSSSALESEVAGLREDVRELQRQFADFKRQFE